MGFIRLYTPMKPYAESGATVAASVDAPTSQRSVQSAGNDSLPVGAQPRVANPPDFDSDMFRNVLGQFATGVTIITTRSEEGGLAGLTASSFNSVSLTPPLILWSLANKSGSLPTFQANTHYVVNVLSSAQVELCLRFATAKGDRFEGVPYRLNAEGIPILEGALAWFECHNRSRYVEGDHVIFVGEVERCGFNDASAEAGPLVFHGGRFHSVDPLE
jgi:flavin reductase (DIM6/NTAB) family NADH-FMN oxidoreductase RutF